MKKIIYKVPNGKLMRISFDIEADVVKKIKITGDFFIHPENAVLDIEHFLVGKKIYVIDNDLSDFLLNNNITVIGFKPIDVMNVLLNIV